MPPEKTNLSNSSNTSLSDPVPGDAAAKLDTLTVNDSTASTAPFGAPANAEEAEHTFFLIRAFERFMTETNPFMLRQYREDFDAEKARAATA
jgi:hypothetical protein